MAENAAVVVWGKLSVRDEKEPQMILNRALPIEDYQPGPVPVPAAPPAAAGKLYVRLDSETVPVYRKVRAVLQMFPGTMPVVLYFADTKQRLAGTCLPDPDLFRELQELLGGENVVIK